MSRVEDIRRALRISNSNLDDEIRDTIDAAVLDLRVAGVGRGDVDALTGMAVKLYARWQFDYRGRGEQYRQAYESLKAVLSMSPDYREGDGNG